MPPCPNAPFLLLPLAPFLDRMRMRRKKKKTVKSWAKDEEFTLESGHNWLTSCVNLKGVIKRRGWNEMDWQSSCYAYIGRRGGRWCLTKFGADGVDVDVTFGLLVFGGGWCSSWVVSSMRGGGSWGRQELGAAGAGGGTSWGKGRNKRWEGERWCGFRGTVGCLASWFWVGLSW